MKNWYWYVILALAAALVLPPLHRRFEVRRRPGHKRGAPLKARLRKWLASRRRSGASERHDLRDHDVRRHGRRTRLLQSGRRALAVPISGAVRPGPGHAARPRPPHRRSIPQDRVQRWL